jgi:hypothetical protein
VFGYKPFKNGFIGFAVGWKAKNVPGYRLPESSYFQSLDVPWFLSGPPALTLTNCAFYQLGVGLIVLHDSHSQKALALNF